MLSPLVAAAKAAFLAAPALAAAKPTQFSHSTVNADPESAFNEHAASVSVRAFGMDWFASVAEQPQHDIPRNI